MDFRLLYEGDLKSNRGAKEKQAIRRVFHGQLADLLSRPAYKYFKGFLDTLHIPEDPTRTTELKGFRPYSLISPRTRHVASLDITLLFREEPGTGVTRSGDLDNRLKTLLDALRVPQNADEIPTGDTPASGENPLYCLLEDDSLISGLAVTADRLLMPAASISHVVAIIRVTPHSTHPTLGTVQFASGPGR